MKLTDDKARATVLAGMELIRWTCDVALWRRWVYSSEATAGQGSVGPVLAAGAIGGAVVFAVVVPFPPLQILAAACGLGLAGIGLADWRLKPRDALPPAHLDPEQPPKVIITTTGLMQGDLALCWDAHDQHLVYAGIGGTGTLYLLFRFRVGKPLRRRLVEVRLPVPPELERDATEVSRSVRRRLNPADASHLFRLQARQSEAPPGDPDPDSR